MPIEYVLRAISAKPTKVLIARVMELEKLQDNKLEA
jgi:hypothetical protein